MIQEFFNPIEAAYPVHWKYAGLGTFNGSECCFYEQYQWMPGKMRYLISVVYAQYSSI